MGPRGGCHNTVGLLVISPGLLQEASVMVVGVPCRAILA
jgi:hypothetical protein